MMSRAFFAVPLAKLIERLQCFAIFLLAKLKLAPHAQTRRVAGIFDVFQFAPALDNLARFELPAGAHTIEMIVNTPAHPFSQSVEKTSSLAEMLAGFGKLIQFDEEDRKVQVQGYVDQLRVGRA